MNDFKTYFKSSLKQAITVSILFAILIITLAGAFALETPTVANPVSAQYLYNNSMHINWTSSTDATNYTVTLYNTSGYTYTPVFNTQSQNTTIVTSSNSIYDPTNITLNYPNKPITQISYLLKISSTAGNATAITEICYATGTCTNTSEVKVNTTTYQTILVNPALVNDNITQVKTYIRREGGGLTATITNLTTYNHNWLINQVPGLYYLNVTANNATASSTATSSAFNITSTLNITATNITGSSINTFTAQVTDLNTSTTTSYPTTTGYAYAYTDQTHTYQIRIDATGYAYAYVNKTQTNYYETQSLTVYPDNGLSINLYNEQSSALLSNYIFTILVQSDTYLANYSTVNGSIGLNISGLTPDDYIITISSNNNSFSTRTYYPTVTDRSFTTINARLLPTSSSDLIGVYTKSQVYLTLPDVLITIQRQYGGGSYATILQKKTDVTGFAAFNIEENIDYRVLLSVTGYEDKQFSQIFYAANSPYTWLLSQTGSTLYTDIWNGINYYYSPTNTILNATTHNFSITTYNATNDIAWTSVTAGGSTTNVSGSPTGSTASLTKDLSNTTGIYPVIYRFNYLDPNTDEYATYSFTINYYVNTYTAYNQTLVTSMEDFKDDVDDEVWQTILAIFIVLAAVITVIQISGNPILGAVGGVAVLAFFALTGWINPIYALISGGLAVLMLFMTR